MGGEGLACVGKTSNGGKGGLEKCQMPGKVGGGGKVCNKPNHPNGPFFFFFFFFFYIMYSLLRYKNSHAALAMA